MELSDTKSDMSGSNLGMEMENSFLNSPSYLSTTIMQGTAGSGEFDSNSGRRGSQSHLRLPLRAS